MNTNATENAPADATNINKGNESLPKTSSIAYMGRTRDNTRHSFGTWSGEQLPTEDHTTLVVHWDSFVNAAVNGSATFHINRDCIDKYNAHVYELRAQEEAEKKRKAERDSAEREERLTIEAITGMDLYPGDLPFMILEYRREGKDFTKILDAMQAIDDLELSRAGRTSWDYDPEMDDPA
ncbi:hypothetical protein [Corynebacterium casei]|uniref:hypothetical protein n=1 Tax=Corynebacterium casei TaxID=160386 RepID=UPI003FCFDD11